MPTPDEFVENYTFKGDTERMRLVLEAYPEYLNMKTFVSLVILGICVTFRAITHLVIS